MDTTKYDDNAFARGQIPIETFIPKNLLQAAKDYALVMQDLTLKGNVKPDTRDEEQIAKDEEAIELLQRLADCEDPALAYGFMLYNETSIVKIYWANRVNKLRYDKSEFFTLDRFLEWLTAIFEVLNGDHPQIHDPLYYYKLDHVKSDGTHVGYYDVMNSFRVQWNRTCLVKIAYLLRLEDKKQTDEVSTISYEGALDNENGAGNHLEAEMAAKGNLITSVDDDDTYRAVEEFLKEFVDGELAGEVPLKSGTIASGMTYKDYMLAIIDGTVNNVSGLRSKFYIGSNVQERINHELEKAMSRKGITLQDLAYYLSSYKTIAIDILNGLDNSFTKVEY